MGCFTLPCLGLDQVKEPGGAYRSYGLVSRLLHPPASLLSQQSVTVFAVTCLGVLSTPMALGIDLLCQSLGITSAFKSYGLAYRIVKSFHCSPTLIFLKSITVETPSKNICQKHIATALLYLILISQHHNIAMINFKLIDEAFLYIGQYYECHESL